MRRQPRWFAPSLVPLLGGLCWLAIGWHAGPFSGLLAMVPGVMLVATGGAQLLWAADRQSHYYMALGALIGSVLAVLLVLAIGVLAALWLFALSVVSYLVAGFGALWRTPVLDGVPRPRADVRLAAKMATDQALLACFISGARVPHGAAAERDARELDVMRAQLAGGEPAADHAPVAVPADARLVPAKSGRYRYEWLSFASRYRPADTVPGARRWLAHRANRRMGARVLRHTGAPRPWVICIHGYRMGTPWLDFPLFDVLRLHHALGLNVIMPLLPLHGPRSLGHVTGSGFLDGPLVELVHAQRQAIDDLRGCVAWVAQYQPQQPIAAVGYSLGGYNAALLAAFEPDLACVVAGIPLCDIPETLWQHMPGIHLRYFEALGVTPALLDELFAPISPLHLAPQLPHARRHIFAATADQLVSPDQPLRLWEHWQRPDIHWYHGSHLSVRREPAVRPFVERALREADVLRSTATA